MSCLVVILGRPLDIMRGMLEVVVNSIETSPPGTAIYLGMKMVVRMR